MSGASQAYLHDLADSVVYKLLQFGPVFVTEANQLRKSLCNLDYDIFAGVDEVQCQSKQHVKILELGLAGKSHAFPTKVLLHLAMNFFDFPALAITVDCFLYDLFFCHVLVRKVA